MGVGADARGEEGAVHDVEVVEVVELTVAGWFDKLLGGVLGLVKAGVLIVLLNMVLSGILAPENKMLKSCMSCPYVNQATDYVRSLIKDDTLREAFLQKKPAIAEKPEKKEKLPDEQVRSQYEIQPFERSHMQIQTSCTVPDW